MVWVVAVLALLLSAAAAGGSVVALRRTRQPSSSSLDAVPEDVLGLRQEVAAMRAEAAGALRHLAVVRYDAFDGMGGHMSWSVALLDDAGDGVVLTSIAGRNEARSYAKGISAWASEQPLSPEEEEAVTHARS